MKDIENYIQDGKDQKQHSNRFDHPNVLLLEMLNTYPMEMITILSNRALNQTEKDELDSTYQINFNHTSNFADRKSQIDMNLIGQKKKTYI